jgi:hypothetical protein
VESRRYRRRELTTVIVLLVTLPILPFLSSQAAPRNDSGSACSQTSTFTGNAFSQTDVCSNSDGTSAKVSLSGTDLRLGAAPSTAPSPVAPARVSRPAVVSRPGASPLCTYHQMTAQEQALYVAIAPAIAAAGAVLGGANTIPVVGGVPGPAPVAPALSLPAAGQVGVEKICGGNVVAISWVATGRPPARPAQPVSPAVLAVQSVLSSLSAAAEIHVPPIGIGLNPPQEGITGLVSYFWVTGYDGSPISTAVNEGGYEIDLRATPTSYTWNFGDGSVLTTASPGLAYPQVSPVGHTYAVRSAVSPDAVNGRYDVRVTVNFDTVFRVVGPGVATPWTDITAEHLQPLSATGQQAYKVVEVVSALTN